MSPSRRLVVLESMMLCAASAVLEGDIAAARWHAGNAAACRDGGQTRPEIEAGLVALVDYRRGVSGVAA
ncbi:hypothetical protein ACFPRL_30120 [Pseudoclavibacter helvolus]